MDPFVAQEETQMTSYEPKVRLHPNIRWMQPFLEEKFRKQLTAY
jgi:hypothetical protein